MKLTLTTLGALALGTSMAHAGGLDRSGQDIGAIFEAGGYAELSYSYASPSISGTMAGGMMVSDNVAPAFSMVGGAVKTDLSDKLSVAVIMDQPFGAAVEYGAGSGALPYALAGTSAHVDSTGITGLVRYKLSDRVSFHGGLRQITASGDITYSPSIVPPVGYSSTYGGDSDLAYVVGGAYEIPAIALRVALTYSSATSFALDGTLGDAAAEMPQSVNLDFQTGIAANTLLFGQIRWADWSEATIDDTLVGNLISYEDDVMTYSVGVGRKFSDSFSGAVTLGYEAATGDLASNLSPTDGYFSIGVGGSYTAGNMKISAGISNTWVGDATTEDVFATFSGNSVLGAGVKVAFTF